MVLAKRIVLFLLVNILVVGVISFILYFFNIQPYLTQKGLNYGSLALFCLIWGMVGSFYIACPLQSHGEMDDGSQNYRSCYTRSRAAAGPANGLSIGKKSRSSKDAGSRNF